MGLSCDGLHYLCLGPVTADIKEVVLGIWSTDEGTVEDVGLLRRGGVDMIDVVAAASHGRVGVDR